jgi:eukaryotic-like serine/threonine-protein kinase
MADNAARKYAALGNIEELQGNHAAALSDIGKALANSQSTQIEFLAASTYVDAGELAKAQKLATSLSSALTSEPQAYGKIVEGMIALKRKDANEAVSRSQPRTTCWTPGSAASNWGGHTWKRERSRRLTQSSINA